MLLYNAITKRRINYGSIVFFMGLYLLNRFWLKYVTHGMVQYFCRCHLNDLLCPLVVLPYIEIWLIYVNWEVKSFLGIISIVLFCGLIWEYVIPRFGTGSVSDPIDMIMYIIGALFYYILLKISCRKSTRLNDTGLAFHKGFD